MKQNTLLKDIERILYTEEEIALAVDRIAKQITEDYSGKSPVFICILKGAAVFFTDLIRRVDLPLSIDFMAISSYGSSTKTSGVVRILKDLDESVEGKDVIIVEDIIDTGLTLSYIKNTLLQRKASSIRIATLLDKPERRKTELEIDYKGLVIPNEFVVGYGLDYDEKYRNLSSIGVLKPSIYMNE
ncbi:MAG: hypoxanthine phosphoribosyltransferase [Christensenellaceae bacterium]|nr:hypoxanthine phosphoribosyltransferase [Christensenellaceae bacterium]